jgi:hypothetical protein
MREFIIVIALVLSSLALFDAAMKVFWRGTDGEPLKLSYAACGLATLPDSDDIPQHFVSRVAAH